MLLKDTFKSTFYWFITLIPFVFVCVLQLSRKYRYWKKRGFPYSKPTLFFGNLHNVFMGRVSLSKRLKEIYEETHDSFIGFFTLDATPVLMVKDPLLIKKILVDDFRYFPNRSFVENSHQDPVGENIPFFAKDDKWNNQRKRFIRIFSKAKLAAKSPLILESAEKLCEYMRKTLKDRNIFNFRDEISKFSVDILASCFLGIEVTCIDNRDHIFVHFAEGLLDWKHKWKCLQFLIMYIGQVVHQLMPIGIFDREEQKFFHKLTWDLIEEREKNQITNNDLIDVLINIKQKEDICRQDQKDALTSLLAQTFAAGHDTITTVVSYAFYELAKEPSIQNDLRHEIRNVFERDGYFTFKNIFSIKYMSAVISEVLRLHPILPVHDRKCQFDYQIPGTQLVIERGTIVYIPIEAIQRDSKYFSDPDKFDPTRFLDEPKFKSEFVYLPFGAGPRLCPGLRNAKFVAACALAYIILNFEVKICKNSHEAAEQHPWAVSHHPIQGIFLELVDLKQ